jgi:superfamily II DNA or RNA helicase
MPPALPRCAHAKIVLRPHSSDVLNDLSALPGVKVVRGVYHVPYHAIELFGQRLTQHGVAFQSASWSRTPPEPVPWEKVEATFRAAGEVREFVLDGFLTQYQKEAIEFAFDRDGSHFWHATGAGKTLTAILFALLRPGPVVVVTRAAARQQYGREISRFTTCEPYVIRPVSELKKKAKRLEQYLDEKRDRHVIVIAWENLAQYADTLIALRPSCVVFDEAHLGKSSKRYESIPLAELSGDAQADMQLIVQQESDARAKGGFISDKDGVRVMIVPLDNIAMASARIARSAARRCATTATPVKDRVRDLWAQLDIVEPDAWGNSTCWLNRYADRKPGTYGGFDTTGSSNLEELAARLKSVVHQIPYTTTHRQLPPKRRQSVYVSPADQAKPSGGFAAEMKAASARGATAVLEVKLAEAASRKRNAVMGIIEDHVYAGGKVVIFTGRRKDCETLGEQVKKCEAVKKTSCPVWVAHGATSATLRQEIVDDYMATQTAAVLVATGDSFGESLNMQDTDAALFVMLPYTPGQVRQWEGRFCRLGQKRPVTIYYVIAEGTVDEHVADILIRKLPAVEKIAKDEELAAAKDVIAGFDTGVDDDTFANGLLSKIASAEAISEDDLDSEDE